jgi:hypothetical protein
LHKKIEQRSRRFSKALESHTSEWTVMLGDDSHNYSAKDGH